MAEVKEEMTTNCDEVGSLNDVVDDLRSEEEAASDIAASEEIQGTVEYTTDTDQEAIDGTIEILKEELEESESNENRELTACILCSLSWGNTQNKTIVGGYLETPSGERVGFISNKTADGKYTYEESAFFSKCKAIKIIKACTFTFPDDVSSEAIIAVGETHEDKQEVYVVTRNNPNTAYNIHQVIHDPKLVRVANVVPYSSKNQFIILGAARLENDAEFSMIDIIEMKIIEGDIVFESVADKTFTSPDGTPIPGVIVTGITNAEDDSIFLGGGFYHEEKIIALIVKLDKELKVVNQSFVTAPDIVEIVTADIQSRVDSQDTKYLAVIFNTIKDGNRFATQKFFDLDLNEIVVSKDITQQPT